MEKGLVSVDKWEEPSQAFFLTHLHTDHTKGLSQKWKRGPLFCSPLSSKLFPSTFPGFDLSLLRVLEEGSTLSLHLSSTLKGSKILVQVTAIDANHCPGAVMYLFRGEFGSFLYTGDFRWETNSERTQLGKTMLLNTLGGSKLDFLYFDNTYCNPSFCFPSREIAAQQVIDIIDSHPTHDIIISINKLGKEDLLLHIAHALNTKIWVWPERLQTMHLLGFEDVFTTDTSLTRVRAVPCYSFTIDTLKSLNSVRGPTLGIIPSGLPWGFWDKTKRNKHGRICIDKSQLSENMSSPRQVHQYVYSVPYSDHSSFREIQEVIEVLQPSNMRGIVSSSLCNVNPLRYFSQLCGSNHQSDSSGSKPKRNYRNEDVEVIGTDTLLEVDKFDEMIKSNKRARKIDCSSAKRQRVRLLRREKRGVNITEM